MLKINQLSLSKRKKTILSEISLEIPSNRITLLLGKSGSGKTTLLRCIAQLETEYEGDISYGHIDLKGIASKDRCQLLGFVPQSYALFPHRNVLDNCAYALRIIFGDSKIAAYEKAEEVLRWLEMETFLTCYPHELSGGQQQRVAIARALVLNPSFILFDEPTSALDPENTERLIEILQRLRAAGRGLVISSQDMTFAKRILDRAYFLEQGALVENYCQTETDAVAEESRLYQFLYAY